MKSVRDSISLSKIRAKSNHFTVHPTSILPGADNYALQQLDVCGPLHLADHFTMIVDPVRSQ